MTQEPSFRRVLPTVLLAALLVPLTSFGRPATTAIATATAKATATATATAHFDTWAESVAVQRMRADPVQSTYRQYLPAASRSVTAALI